MFTNASSQWQQGGVLLINHYHVLVYHSLSNSSQTASTRPALHVASYYPSQPTVCFLAQLLSVSKRKANEVNVILGQRCGDSVQCAGRSNSWECLMAAEKLFQRHFGWRNNCFQSSTRSNCTLSTQTSSPPSKNLLPTNIYRVCSPEKNVLGFFSPDENGVGSHQLFGLRGWLRLQSVYLVFCSIYSTLFGTVSGSTCAEPVLQRSSPLGLMMEQGNHSGWL